jgi:hypothetical protein
MPVVVVESVVVIVDESVVAIAPESGVTGAGAGAGTAAASVVVSVSELSSAEQAPNTSSDDAARTVKNERFIPTSDEGPMFFDGTRHSDVPSQPLSRSPPRATP